MNRLLALSVTLMLASPIIAQVSVNVDADRNRSSSYDRNDATQEEMEPLRASELMGHTIVNGDDETLGSIEDLVLDRNDGSIKYVAVSMGGFLGVGDKLFAVPYKKLDCRQNDGEHVITLDTPEQQLKNAKGFDQDDWPNMASTEWQKQNDRAYGSGTRSGSTTR
ncbi:MAG: PRC-barrel domain-containing protein [Planctomycetota bacterium]